jgi:hypothetical protein
VLILSIIPPFVILLFHMYRGMADDNEAAGAARAVLSGAAGGEGD